MPRRPASRLGGPRGRRDDGRVQPRPHVRGGRVQGRRWADRGRSARGSAGARGGKFGCLMFEEQSCVGHLNSSLMVGVEARHVSVWRRLISTAAALINTMSNDIPCAKFLRFQIDQARKCVPVTSTAVLE